MMQKHLLSLFFIGFFGIACSQNSFKKLDDFFKVLEENHKVMGSFAIAKNDQIIYTKSVGFADVENNRTADQNTVYRIGSITKPFTAVLIMKAVEEGKLKLSDKLHQFLPHVMNSDKITVEYLLQHRSGIHNFTDDQADYYTYNTKEIDQKFLIDKISKYESEFEPGTKYSYSNSNYFLLSYILEKVYKMPFDRLLTLKITKPLGVKFTAVGKNTDVDKNAASSYQFYNNNYVKSSETNLSVASGSGNIVSTPSELLKFAAALENGELISEESLKLMQNYRDRYGFGLTEVPFYGKKGYGHNGRIDEFLWVLYYFPDEKVSIAFITNQSNFDNNQISIAMLSAAYGLDFKIPSFKIVAVPETELKKLEGVYSSPNFPLKITVFVENGTLKAQATGQSSFPLEATSNSTFKFDIAGIDMEFVPEKKQMNYSQMGNKLTFTKE